MEILIIKAEQMNGGIDYFSMLSLLTGTSRYLIISSNDVLYQDVTRLVDAVDSRSSGSLFIS